MPSIDNMRNAVYIKKLPSQESLQNLTRRCLVKIHVTRWQTYHIFFIKKKISHFLFKEKTQKSEISFIAGCAMLLLATETFLFDLYSLREKQGLKTIIQKEKKKFLTLAELLSTFLNLGEYFLNKQSVVLHGCRSYYLSTCRNVENL